MIPVNRFKLQIIHKRNKNISYDRGDRLVNIEYILFFQLSLRATNPIHLHFAAGLLGSIQYHLPNNISQYTPITKLQYLAHTACTIVNRWISNGNLIVIYMKLSINTSNLCNVCQSVEGRRRRNGKRRRHIFLLIFLISFIFMVIAMRFGVCVCEWMEWECLI